MGPPAVPNLDLTIRCGWFLPRAVRPLNGLRILTSEFVILLQLKALGYHFVTLSRAAALLNLVETVQIRRARLWCMAIMVACSSQERVAAKSE